MSSGNVSFANLQPISAGNAALATVKVEPLPVSCVVAGPTFPHNPSVPHATSPSEGVPSLQTSSPSSTSQDNFTSNENVQEPVVSIVQPICPVNPALANLNILNNLSQVQQVMNFAALSGGTSTGLQSMGQSPIAMQMSNMISNRMTSSVPVAQNVFSSGQSGITSITSSATLTGPWQTGQNIGIGSLTPASSNLYGSSNIGISQPLNNLQGAVSVGQHVQGMSQGNLSGSQTVQNEFNMNQNVMNGLGVSDASSGNGRMIPTPGVSQQAQSSLQPLVNNTTNMTLPQQEPGGMQSTQQSKYVKVWEIAISVFAFSHNSYIYAFCWFVTRVTGTVLPLSRKFRKLCQLVLTESLLRMYRECIAGAGVVSVLAANWPPVMQIVRLIPQDHMNNRQYVGKADFLVFRSMKPHGFLGQMREKKLCAVIQLPSQTLLLCVSDNECRLIGMLLPEDMVVFKQQLSSQQHQQMQSQLQYLPQFQQQQFPHMQQQQQQLSQLQQHLQLQHQLSQWEQFPYVQQQLFSQLQQQQLPQMQQLSQLPQLQQLSQQQQIVGLGIGEGYVQGLGRSQSVSQGQISSQGANDISEGGFMS
ncbi:unnamed protein product [Lupinus luteus]|uniref:Mediator of RNA polymerase II transcription subunit 25 n=1 Tax=Lupinus luteus TaxID=3873 RepID=A0AAV1X9Z7_LUPLU